MERAESADFYMLPLEPRAESYMLPLPLFCDQLEPSENLLSRKRLRSQICDYCSSEPKRVRGSTDDLALREMYDGFPAFCLALLDSESADKKANQSVPSIQEPASPDGSRVEPFFIPPFLGSDLDDKNANQVMECGGGDNGVSFSPRGKLRRSISSWQKGELLGSGSFGTVYEGYTEDGYFLAVKEVVLLEGKQKIACIEREISLLEQFEHENIVRYLGTEKDDSRIYIFLELVPKGSLASLYQKYHLKDSQVSAYTKQILNGLKYLHDKKVIHRDIKCSNILVDASGSVKLADFGLAKVTKLNDMSCQGSPFWMAPEVVNLKNRSYGLAADIWSLGCTVLEMLTREHPYSDCEHVQAYFKIGKGEPPEVPDSLSRDARDFILKCLQVNPNDRPTATQLLDHPFVTRAAFVLV